MRNHEEHKTRSRFLDLISRESTEENIRKTIRAVYYKIPYVMEYEDLVQEAISRCYSKQSDFKGESEGELLRWCQKIAWSILIDELRRKRREEKTLRVEVDSDYPAFTGETPQESVEKRDLLEAAINLLSERERNVLKLRYLYSLGMDQIGLKLGISPSAAKQLHYRALNKIRESLKR